MQIVVLGMHRCGTSLTTRLINMMGAYFGAEGMCGYNNDNPKGYWERPDVVQCNASLLKLYHPLWPHILVTPWMVSWQAHAPAELHHRMKSAVMSLDAHRPWVMKDPHLCLTLPYWRPLLEVPVGVVLYRDPLEIARSLCIRERNAVPSIELGVALWECYAVSLLNACGDLPCVFSSYADFQKDPVAATTELYNGLVKQGVQGLRLPAAREITAFIDPALYRAKPTADTAYTLTAAQRELAEMLQGIRPRQDALQLSEKSQQIMHNHAG